MSEKRRKYISQYNYNLRKHNLWKLQLYCDKVDIICRTEEEARVGGVLVQPCQYIVLL